LIVCRIPDLVCSGHSIIDLRTIAVCRFVMDFLAPLLDPIEWPRTGSIIKAVFGGEAGE